MKKIILVLITCLFIGCSQNPAEEAVKQYVNAAYNGDIGTMSGLLYISDGNLLKDGSNEVIKGKLKLMVLDLEKTASQNGGFKDVKIIETKLNGEDTAYIRAKILFRNKTESDSDFTVKKDRDGKWKIEL